MSEPFISRRCQNCGASIRKSGSFCPQCGTQAVGGSAVTGTQERSKGTGQERKSQITKELREPSLEKAEPKARPGGKTSRSVQYSSLVESEKPSRSASAARNARIREAVGSRVDQVKHRSNAMIDEAAVDPSFRFILVTAVLFVLFVLLLFFSHILR